MTLLPGDSYYRRITTRRADSGQATDADSTPTVAVIRNGATTGDMSVTVVNAGTGRYDLSATIPGGWAAGDVVDLQITAIVNGITDHAVVDRFVLDSKRFDDLADFDPSSTGVNVTKLAGNVTAGTRLSAMAATLNASGEITSNTIASGALVSTALASSYLAAMQSEANDALVANRLDHLLLNAVTTNDVATGTVVARIAGKGATPSWATYNNTTDSLEAIRDSQALQTTVTGLNKLIGTAADLSTDVFATSVFGQLLSTTSPANYDRTTDSLEALAATSLDVPGALEAIGLHKLISTNATISNDVWSGSVLGQIMASSNTNNYDRTTDSLEAIAGNVPSLSSPLQANVVQVGGNVTAARNLRDVFINTGSVTIKADITGNITTVGSVTTKTGYSLASSQAFNNTGQTTEIPANVTEWSGNAVVYSATAGLPAVDIQAVDDSTTKATQLAGLIGSGQINGNLTGSVGSISGVTFPSNFGSMVITGAGLTHAEIRALKNTAVTSFNQFKATVTGMSTLTTNDLLTQGIAAINDRFTFASGDVVATLSGETVALSTATQAQVDAIESTVSTINGTKLNTNRMALIDALPASFPSNFASLSIDVTGRVDVGSWSGVAVSTGVTSGLPVVDVHAIDDSAAAATSAATNIGNLDAAVTSRAASATALSDAVWTDAKAAFIDAAVTSRAASATALTDATWTDAKAAFLDAAVTSRAPSATALSDAVWTDTKAGYIDAAVSSRAASATALTSATWTDVRAGYLDKLNVSGTLAHTNNASVFKADAAPGTASILTQVLAAIDTRFSFASGDVVATLSGETVALSTATEAQIDAIHAARLSAGQSTKLDALPASFPTNFATLTIDATGRVDVGSWSGVAVTTGVTSGLPVVDVHAIDDSAAAASSAAASISNLDAAVSSRAASATALSDAVWTDAKAAFIDAAVTSRAASATALSDDVWTDQKAGHLDAAVSSRAASATALSDAVWTDAKAAFIDASVTSRASSATALSNATWTDQKAGFVDAAVSSRAASNTALTSATWTDTRAAYLDKLNVTGTLAHTNNASVFRADVSGLTTSVATATAKIDTLLSRVPDTISLAAIQGAASAALVAYDVLASGDLPANFASLAIDANGRVTIQGTLNTLDALENLSSSDVAAAVLDAQQTNHDTAGTIGAKINDIATGQGTAVESKQDDILTILQAIASNM